jgi:acetyl esterase/lipase
MDPADFPPQGPSANPRVEDYVARACALSAPVLQAVPPLRRAYGPDRSHRLDIFGAGGEAKAPRPALIFFHGGAWTSGYMWWTSFMAPGVAAAGGVLVAPTYRLGPANRLHTQLGDVAAAIAWVWRHAGTYGIDPDRIVVGGHSAGGHLSTLAALHPDALPGAGMPLGVLRACVPVSASFNLHYPDPQPGSGEQRVYDVLLARPGDDREASPVTHVSGAAPPLSIVCGGRDFERIVRTSREMAARTLALGGRAVLEEWAGLDHFDTHLRLGDPDHPWYARLQGLFDGN